LRPGLLLCALLSAAPALGQDARLNYASKQLATASDPRIRVSSALLLGRSNNPAAVAPLCNALKDAEAVVRSAVAGALGELAKFPDSIACLKSAPKDSDASVRAAIARALEAAGPALPAGLAIAIEPVIDKVGSLSPEVLTLADGLIREKVQAMGATIVPAVDPKGGKPPARGAKAFQLRAQLTPGDDKSLKLEILVMTYPDLALQGSWNVKAKGGKPESLLKKMVPVVVDNAANELEWK
jgi:hypothetical protein